MVLAKSYSDQATGTRARPVGVRAPTAATKRANGLAGRRAAAPAMARMIWRPVGAWRAARGAGRPAPSPPADPPGGRPGAPRPGGRARTIVAPISEPLWEGVHVLVHARDGTV